jgi:hypothetical protein
MTERQAPPELTTRAPDAETSTARNWALSDEDRAWLRNFVALFLASNRHERPTTAIDLGIAALERLRRI